MYPEHKEILERYPRLTAHLIATSLGYFTPEGAANAILHYKADKPFACEWYSHMAMGGDADQSMMFDHDRLLAVGSRTLSRAVSGRHGHKGYMADYGQALAIVRRTLETGRGPTLASWF